VLTTAFRSELAAADDDEVGPAGASPAPAVAATGWRSGCCVMWTTFWNERGNGKAFLDGGFLWKGNASPDLMEVPFEIVGVPVWQLQCLVTCGKERAGVTGMATSRPGLLIRMGTVRSPFLTTL
jgi:hypothetical protein